MHRLHLIRSVAHPRPDKRSAKVIELRVRREARNEARKPQPPHDPSAA
jgi:hypothetical protein